MQYIYSNFAPSIKNNETTLFEKKIKMSNIKELIFIGSCLIFAFVAMAFTSSKDIVLSNKWIQTEALQYNVASLGEFEEEQLYKTPLYLGKSFVGFKEALAFKESRGIYNIVNRFGYLGKYQFGKTSLKSIGITNYESFKTDTYLQEAAFIAYTSQNKFLLRDYIEKYEGKEIAGVHITESGILAAAHLSGASNVKKFLRSNGSYQFKDAFGTSLKYYLKLFSGYDTSFIPADNNAVACN